MLTAEQAEKQLSGIRQEEKVWFRQRLASAATLPARLAETARGLLGRDAKGREPSDWQKRFETRAKACRALDALSAADRGKVFARLFGKAAPFVEGAWQAVARTPYQVGYGRKPFRAAGDPAATQAARGGLLENLVECLKGLDQDIEWIAAWAPHLGGYGAGEALGHLLAAAIDAGGPVGDRVLEILKDSAAGRHEVGSMGRHVTRALLTCSRPEAWEFVEKLLLAAQRQEGLRQVILETVDEAHPEAFRRMVRPIVWPWQVFTADRPQVATKLVFCLGDRPAARLIPHLEVMDPGGRYQTARRLTEIKKPDAQVRETLFRLVGDATSLVREQALAGLAKCKVTDEEAAGLEKLLSRKSGDLRRGVLDLLARRLDAGALASADRLLSAGTAAERSAGLQLLRTLKETDRSAAACRERAERFAAGRAKISEDERTQLDAVLSTAGREPTLDDALGLMDPSRLTPPTPPQPRKVTFVSAAAVACLEALDRLVAEHAERQIEVTHWNGKTELMLLGDANWKFPSPDHRKPPEGDAARLPLREVWEGWWADRPAAQRDRDGLEMVRALLCPQIDRKQIAERLRKAVDPLVNGPQPKDLKYASVVFRLVWWMIRLHAPAGAAEFALDAAEAALAMVPAAELARAPKVNPDGRVDQNWDGSFRQYSSPFLKPLDLADNLPSRTAADVLRLWRLRAWVDRPAPGWPRSRVHFLLLLEAVRRGAANEHDVYDHLLGPRDNPWSQFNELGDLTARRPPTVFDEHPFLRTMAERCRNRVLEVELARGEKPTAATAPALSLGCVPGIANLIRLLRALGRSAIARGVSYYDRSRAYVFSRLISVSHPAPGDTPDAFADAVRAAGDAVPQERLLQLAVFAPQWLRFVDGVLQWKGLEDGVWWIVAHTKGTDLTVAPTPPVPGVPSPEPAGPALRPEIAERTSVTAEDLADGAVDVAWFHRAYEALGKARWAELDAAAKYAASGTGHTRARLFASAMLGELKKSELLPRITAKRQPDAVRALGLLPLPGGAKREAELLSRYRVIQEFLRTGRQFGMQRRATEKRAAQIGLANLARTAGYPDPVRLEWAMEARALGDLAKGPVTAKVGDVTVTLAVDADGLPDVAVARAGNPLKTVPPAVRKNARYAELAELKTELRRQASRMRRSLEEAMVRGDLFTGAELRQLFGHPVLAAMLRRLVLLGDGSIGYPAEGGQLLVAHDGRREPVGKAEALRIAHPHDLLAGGAWHLWQRECFSAERVQPFKQVFRELYPITAAEKGRGRDDAEAAVSRRYAGQQINPGQAMALFGSRGWLADAGEGVRRVFHEAGLIAAVTFQNPFFTAAEVEGLTLEGVRFFRRGTWRNLALEEVPPRLFSEVMRDVDLVVSVAHRGGVDPEASASTMEMRAALLTETCSLLKIGNVRVQPPHVLVNGALGKYSVHLGSAVTHKRPGGAVFLVPVHAAHRGRLFLPFADDDPRTAEVISKVVLLARDREIQDPTILDQLR